MKFRLNLVALGFVASSTACAGGSLRLQNPSPILDMDRIVLRASGENPFPATSTVFFEWRVDAPDLQLDGDGYARLQDPDRARLDLFTGDNEAVLSAGLVEDELWAREERALDFVPSPALLWAFLGTFRPGEGATRLYGEFDGDDFRLDYGLPNGDELQYLFRSGRIAQVEVHQEGHAVHRVLLAWGGGRELPSEATYRNLSSRSQLKVAVGTVERVDSHPSDIWYLVP